MGWQIALIDRLLADGSLEALVADRIYWVERPQGCPLPAVTLLTVSDTRDQHLKGFESLQPARVQIDVWAANYGSGKTVAEAVLGAVVPAHTGGGTVFSRAMVDLPPRDLAEQQAAPDGKTKTIFRTSMDLIFNHAISIEEGS